MHIGIVPELSGFNTVSSKFFYDICTFQNSFQFTLQAGFPGIDINKKTLVLQESRIRRRWLDKYPTGFFASICMCNKAIFNMLKREVE